mmetsp:Transcript_25452/g.62614  ORF Transcript_25452/g.62614 Transcript_25452/m.62614 type:complete len:87 (-) Transcript_25452:410-670(-)
MRGACIVRLLRLFALSYLHLAAGELLLFNNDFETTANRALELGNRYAKLNPSYFTNPLETFHRAVAVYALQHCEQKRESTKSKHEG